MIISHSHKFVYTRPMKVGSSSAQVMLDNSDLVLDTDVSLGSYDNAFDAGFGITKNISLPEDRLGAVKLKAELMHATPEILLNKGFINEEIVSNYLFISIIRNPIDRFLSAWVMEVIGGYDFTGSRDKFFDMLDARDFPLMLSHASPNNYFKLADNLLPNIAVLKTKTLFDDLVALFPDTKLIRQNLKQTKYPNWLSKTILDKKYLTIIKDYLAEEVIFYETNTGEIVC